MRNFQAFSALCVLGATVMAVAVGVSGQALEQQMLVSVVDGDGQPVPGLRPSDFMVREDGVAREVLRVSPETGPRQIALLVDTSQAASPVMGDFRSAVSQFVELMSENNRISLITFGGTPRIVTDATDDPAALREAVDRLFAQPETATYLLDAVAETVEGFRRRQSARPVIVVLTTLGVEYGNRYAQLVVEQLRDTGIAMHTIVVNTTEAAVGTPTMRPEEIELRRLERDRLLAQGPEVTGGRYREVQASMGAPPALVDLAHDLRSQYLIVYARPDTLIPPERIEVEVRRDGHALDARGTPINLGS